MHACMHACMACLCVCIAVSMRIGVDQCFIATLHGPGLSEGMNVWMYIWCVACGVRVYARCAQLWAHVWTHAWVLFVYAYTRCYMCAYIMHDVDKWFLRNATTMSRKSLKTRTLIKHNMASHAALRPVEGVPVWNISNNLGLVEQFQYFICVCHPCAGAMLIFSVSFHFKTNSASFRSIQIEHVRLLDIFRFRSHSRAINVAEPRNGDAQTP